MRRRHGRETAQRLQHLVAIGLQGVDPEIDRRAFGQSRTLLSRAFAEGAGELGRKPLRIIATNMLRRIVAKLAFQPRTFLLRQWCWCIATAVGEGRYLVRCHAQSVAKGRSPKPAWLLATLDLGIRGGLGQ